MFPSRLFPPLIFPPPASDTPHSVTSKFRSLWPVGGFHLAVVCAMAGTYAMSDVLGHSSYSQWLCAITSGRSGWLVSFSGCSDPSATLALACATGHWSLSKDTHCGCLSTHITVPLWGIPNQVNVPKFFCMATISGERSRLLTFCSRWLGLVATASPPMAATRLASASTDAAYIRPPLS
jgi:hypothetical protein